MSQQGNSTETQAANEKPSLLRRKDEGWDDRLRRVGDANYVAVEWSSRDQPSWPLPTK